MTAIEQLKQLVETVLEKLGVTGTVSVEEQEMGYRIIIDSEDSALLIGRSGETLDALQMVIRLLSHQLALGEMRIRVDINGYRQQKEDDLARFVGEIAARVKETGQSETLRPMTAYERRIAHQAASDAGATSESTGEGVDRRIVIKPL